MDDVLELYRDTILQCCLAVRFHDEQGLDVGGLTQKLFTTFWYVTSYSNSTEADCSSV